MDVLNVINVALTRLQNQNPVNLSGLSSGREFIDTRLVIANFNNFIIMNGQIAEYSVSITDIRNYANQLSIFIEDQVASWANGQYRSVIDSPLFGHIYSVGNRSFRRIDKGVQGWGTEQGVFCRECGYDFPVRNITIDHQRPQAGGGKEAVAKVFRAAGLTIGSPIGSKGKFMNDLTIADRLALQSIGTMDETVRYSLSNDGNIIYTLVKAANNLENLESACMHSILNLKPLCGSCNSSRGNPVKFP